MNTGLAILFGVIGAALFVLYILNKIATKYLNGDYIVIEEDDDEMKIGVEEPSGSSQQVEIKTKDYYAKARMSEIEARKEKTVMPNTYNENDSGPGVARQDSFASRFSMSFKDDFDPCAFAREAQLHYFLEYIKSSNVVAGIIHSVDGLDMTSTSVPEEVCFYVKLTTNKGRYGTKTSWKSLLHTASIPFVIGPLRGNVDVHQGSIRVQMLGRSEILTSSGGICYGECQVSLSELFRAKTGIRLNQRLRMKKIVSTDRKSTFSTDSDLIRN